MASPASIAPAPSADPLRRSLHRPELDVLRFGAFFLVFLHHALPHASAEYGIWRPAAILLASLGRAGAWGVDLFFALSAYLITSLLLREQREFGGVDVRAFYTRRVLRIWPLYFASLALAVLLPGESMPGRYVWAYGLLAGNWACAWWGFPVSSFASLWSVSIEEQFYLTWPLAMRGASRHLVPMAIGALVIANLTRVWLVVSGTTHPGIWCNTLTRLDPIALGVLLASRERLPRASKGLLATFALGALLVLGLWGDQDGPRALFTYPLAALASAAAVVATLDVPLANPVLVYLGKISYGLYVFHHVILHAFEGLGRIGVPLSLAATILTAGLSYRYFESPFLRWKDRFARVRSRPV